MTNRFGRSAPPPVSGPREAGLLAGFDVLRRTLSDAAARAVAGRLRAGHSHDRIRAEVPETAARQALERFPLALGFEESVHAFVRERVEVELTGAGGDADG